MVTTILKNLIMITLSVFPCITILIHNNSLRFSRQMKF